MADVKVEFGAKDVGLEKTIKAIENQLVSLDKELKSGTLSFDQIKNKMREVAQAEKLHQSLGGTSDRLRNLGLASTSASGQVDRLGREMRQTGAQADALAGKAKGAGMSLSSMRGAIAGLGLGAVAAQARQVIKEFDRVDKLAKRFDTTAESIQRVSTAARLSGTDIEVVAQSLTKAGVAATKVILGNEQMSATFERAGIDARRFSEADLDQKLIQISEAFQAANGDATKTNAIIEILGTRGGANLIPLIKNVDELKASMEGAAVASDDVVAKMAQMNDRIETATQNMKIFGAEALNAFTDLFEMLGSAMAGQGLKTIKEMNDEMERMNAEARLAQRGITRPEEDRTTKVEMRGPRFAQIPVTVSAPGPKAAEFEKQLQEELEAMRKETHEAEVKRKEKEKQIAQANADAQEKAEKDVTREKKRQLDLEKERANVKMAELAEKEAMLLRVEQEAMSGKLETERKILEARANGNEELVKQIRNQERYNKLLGEFLKAGETMGAASSKASEMIANEMKALELEAQKRTRADTAPTGGGGGGARGATPTPSFGQGMVEGMRGQVSQTELLKKIDPGMFNASAKSVFDEFGKAVGAGRAGRASDILKRVEGRIEREERRGRIAQRLGEGGEMPNFRQLQEEALKLQTELKGGIEEFGDWTKITGMSSTELEEFTENLMKASESMESMEAPEVPKVEAPGAAAAEAAKQETPEQGLMTKIGEAVEAIKLAVEKIEPKLPMQALAP